VAALPCLIRCVSLLTLLAVPASALPPGQPLAPIESAAAGDLDLSLGFRRDEGDTQSANTAFVALSLPLERLAAPKLGAELPTPDAPSAEATAAARAPSAEEPTLAPALPAPELARLARETVSAALRRENLPLRARELDSLAARAKSSAVLPELRLRATRSQDEALRLAPTPEDPYRFSLAGGNALVLEASASWRLNRLVFADEELTVERMRLEEERTRERLTARVIEKVLAWHRALSHERSGDERLRERSTLERLEAEVELDVTTGGFFAEVARKAILRAATVNSTRPRSRPEPAHSGHAEPARQAPRCFPEAEPSARLGSCSRGRQDLDRRGRERANATAGEPGTSAVLPPPRTRDAHAADCGGRLFRERRKPKDRAENPCDQRCCQQTAPASPVFHVGFSRLAPIAICSSKNAQLEARSSPPCSLTHETDSRTFNGVSMR
jgi:hypothetical protein